MPNPIPIRALPTSSLLGLLVGDVAAAALAGRSLVDLFSLRSRPSAVRENDAGYGVVRVFDAAKELLARAYGEEMRFGDCLSAPDKVRELLRLRYADLPHEVFAVLLLDAQNRLIVECELFRGTLAQTSVYPREVVKLALSHNAASAIFAHNHPSGCPDPSEADITLTRTLRQALALVDVRTVDHFVVAGNGVPVSFAERGLI